MSALKLLAQLASTWMSFGVYPKPSFLETGVSRADDLYQVVSQATFLSHRSEFDTRRHPPTSNKL